MGYITSYRWITIFFFNIPLQLNIRFQMSLITNNEDTKISVNIFSFFFWDRDLEMGLQARFRILQGFWEQDLHSGALCENVTHLHFHQVLGIKKLDYPGGPVVKFACQCRGFRFNPYSGRIPHAPLRATKPMHRSYWACALEPVLHNGSHCSRRIAPSCCN